MVKLKPSTAWEGNFKEIQMFIVISVMGKDSPDYLVKDTETGETRGTFSNSINAQSFADFLKEQERKKNDNTSHDDVREGVKRKR